MMNTIKRARVHLVKFLFILPLMSVLLVAFRHRVEGMFQKLPDTVPRKGIKFGFTDEKGAKSEGSAINMSMEVNLTKASVGHLPTVMVGTDRDGKFTIKVIGMSKEQAALLMPLFVFDGVPAARIPDNLYIRDIYSVDMLQPPASNVVYGLRGGHGAIVVTTRKKMEPTVNDLHRAGIRDGIDLAKAVYFVNGVETPLEKVQQLDGDALQHISVLKGALDTAAYGTKGKYGVVQVWTKEKVAGTGYVSSSTDTMYTYFHKL